MMEAFIMIIVVLGSRVDQRRCISRNGRCPRSLVKSGWRRKKQTSEQRDWRVLMAIGLLLLLWLLRLVISTQTYTLLPYTSGAHGVCSRQVPRESMTIDPRRKTGQIWNFLALDAKLPHVRCLFPQLLTTLKTGGRAAGGVRRHGGVAGMLGITRSRGRALSIEESK